MSSLRRIEASRANGAKSRGPATPQGRRISSLNATRHGLTAKTVVLTNESTSRFEQVLQSYYDQFQPQTEVEMDLVEEMAVAKWRQRRAWSIETATLDHAMDRQDPELTRKWESLDHPTRLAVAYESSSGDSNTLQLLSRYETRLRRHYEKSLHNLVFVKTHFLPNEPSPENEQS